MASVLVLPMSWCFAILYFNNHPNKVL